MHGFKSTFRVVEADLNCRRTDYSILEVHDVAIGRTFPGLMDFLDQNIEIVIDPINITKTGSESADGPVGRGHYYPQVADFNISTYCANPSTLIRVDTFSGGFFFTARPRDKYFRRQLFFRSKFKSSIIVDDTINSIWFKDLNSFSPDGILDIDLLSTIDVHSYINAYSFLYGMTGNVDIYYSNLDEEGNVVGFNSGNFSGFPKGTEGTDFESVSSDPRFSIPPPFNAI